MGLVLKTQRNRILAAIQEQGLDPTEFEWQDLSDLCKIKHISSGFQFLFHIRNQRPSMVEFSPGSDKVNEGRGCQDKYEWVSLLEHVGEWATYLKRELDEPDLWAIASEQRKRIKSATAPGAANTPFTEKEQRFISAKLDEIRNATIATHQLNKAQVKLLTEQLDFLREQSKTQGRRSWLQMALGAVLTSYLSKIDSAAVQALLARIVEAFTPLVTKLLPGG